MLIKKFEDIDVWKEARKLVNIIYGSFPEFVASFFCNLLFIIGLRQIFVHWAKFNFLGISAADKVLNDQFCLYQI